MRGGERKEWAGDNFHLKNVSFIGLAGEEEKGKSESPDANKKFKGVKSEGAKKKEKNLNHKGKDFHYLVTLYKSSSPAHLLTQPNSPTSNSSPILV
jgi:hypothetical protein